MKPDTFFILKQMALYLHKRWVTNYWDVKKKTCWPRNIQRTVDFANKIIEKHRDKL